MTFTVAIDAMGGDAGVSVTIPAALRLLHHVTDAHLILVGQPEAIHAELAHHRTALHERLTVHAASQVVTMDEAPQLALKNKKDSSMRVAINLVKEGQAQACVSAGNTGALMATARFVLKTLPGIDRPAIAKMLPNAQGKLTCMLDLGANVDSSPEQLLQFAVMGATLVEGVCHIRSPKVGLLNVGTEDMKGNEVVKQTLPLLQNSGLNFYGNVEGNDIYTGTVDVIVCDGFVGNVALKTSEGLVRMIAAFLREEFTRSWISRGMAVLSWPVLQRFRQRVDARRYNGASLLGLRGIVVKSHGGTDALGFSCAIEQALAEVRANVIQQITQHVARHLARDGQADAEES